jgi:hypothetical protein
MADLLYERKSKNYLAGAKRVALFADGSFFLDDEKHLLPEKRLEDILRFLSGNEEFLNAFVAKKVLSGEMGATLTLVHKKFVVPEIALKQNEKDPILIASVNEKDDGKWRAYTIFRQIESLLFLNEK